MYLRCLKYNRPLQSGHHYYYCYGGGGGGGYMDVKGTDTRQDKKENADDS